MLAAIFGIFKTSKLVMYGIAAVAFIAAIAGIRYKWKSEGRVEEQQKAQERAKKAETRMKRADVPRSTEDVRKNLGLGRF